MKQKKKQRPYVFLAWPSFPLNSKARFWIFTVRLEVLSIICWITQQMSCTAVQAISSLSINCDLTHQESPIITIYISDVPPFLNPSQDSPFGAERTSDSLSILQDGCSNVHHAKKRFPNTPGLTEGTKSFFLLLIQFAIS